MDTAFLIVSIRDLPLFKVAKVHKSVGGGGAAELQR